MNKKERRLAILEMACTQYEKEGQIEIDGDAKLSEGDDNGTYVQAWVWVDLSNTVLCKGEDSSNDGKDGDHSNCDEGCPVFDKGVADAK